MSETTTDLELVSTEDLTDELFRRNGDIILITENKKADDIWEITAKTGKGCVANKELSYDLIVTTDMLTCAITNLTLGHFEDEMDDQDDSPEPE